MQWGRLILSFSLLLVLQTTAAYAANSCSSVLSTSNAPRALFLDDEKEVASARLRFLQKENEEVAAAYYQMDGNKIGPVVFGELIAAKQRGAKVRLLLDSWNPEDWIDQRLTPAMYKALIVAGVEIRIFNLVDPTKLGTFLNAENFVRMHDKLLILKGQNIVSEGDRNIQNSNFRIQLRKNMKGKSYRSVEILIEDQKITDSTLEYFNEMWKLSIIPDTSLVSALELSQTQKKIKNAFQTIRRRTDLVEHPWEQHFKEVAGVDFFHDVPGEKTYRSGIGDSIHQLLSQAKKSIVIYSPYLYLTPRFEQVIKEARANGVVVTFFLPSWESIDTPLTLQHFEKQAAELAKLGVVLRQHVGADFMHAKMAIVDEEHVFVGSYNFNPRSELNDYETGLVVHDKTFARTVVEFHNKMIELESAPFRDSNKSMLDSIKIWFLRILVRFVPFFGRQI